MSLALSASLYVTSATVSASGVSPSTRSAVASDAHASGSPAEKEAESPTERVRNAADSQKVNGQSLEEAELAQLKELKARDREVRAHEAAHQSVGGQHAGAVSYTYSRGPDGVQYAVGGEVSIDVAPVPNNPQATIDKMRVVRAAALAPAEPSSQDRQVAAQAMQTMLQAQVELAAGRRPDTGEDDPESKASESETQEDSSQRQISRQEQHADNTYQRVSALAQTGNTSSFQATA
ncbi:hypothetical protein RE428_17130 [Marinobacter nanhaiticus D15-8W]|uniref:putative metalloprotease CJM1_0395 family protein n=1 Tax=Marinobacter nanhaiticus TaxID=1305740 RepID=UPI0002CCC955|nr:putative metalloprotease CJM1_0395 family protein [Marinobacter nanhaiticus]BES70695.1 hypothetical protein RE428_17130 [Marinobacter nanhaiticus D15-8W]